jgi:hypothetical protein
MVASSSIPHIDPLWGPEFQVLCVRFSSGITLKDLCSVGTVVASLAGIARPPRGAKRSFQAIVSWFVGNCGAVFHVLPLVGLEDAVGIPINGRHHALRAPFFVNHICKTGAFREHIMVPRAGHCGARGQDCPVSGAGALRYLPIESA